jgi:hypothetical protein
MRARTRASVLLRAPSRVVVTRRQCAATSRATRAPEEDRSPRAALWLRSSLRFPADGDAKKPRVRAKKLSAAARAARDAERALEASAAGSAGAGEGGEAEEGEAEAGEEEEEEEEAPGSSEASRSTATAPRSALAPAPAVSA